MTAERSGARLGKEIHPVSMRGTPSGTMPPRQPPSGREGRQSDRACGPLTPAFADRQGNIRRRNHLLWRVGQGFAPLQPAACPSIHPASPRKGADRFQQSLLRQSDTLQHWSWGRTRRRPGHPRATLRDLQPATVSRVGDKDIPHNRRERRLQLSPRRIDHPGRLVAELEKNDGRDVLLSVTFTIENASRGSLKQLEAARA